jgi:hypothetical protein
VAEGVRRGPFAGNLSLAGRPYPGNLGSADPRFMIRRVSDWIPRVGAAFERFGLTGAGGEAGDYG